MASVPVGFMPVSRGTRILGAYARDVNVLLDVDAIYECGLGKELRYGVNLSGLKGGEGGFGRSEGDSVVQDETSHFRC